MGVDERSELSVSISCFSGGLSFGGARKHGTKKRRIEYSAKLRDRKSQKPSLKNAQKSVTQGIAFREDAQNLNVKRELSRSDCLGETMAGWSLLDIPR